MVFQYLPLKSQIQSVDTVSTWSSLNNRSSVNCFDNIIVQPNEDQSLEVFFFCCGSLLKLTKCQKLIYHQSLSHIKSGLIILTRQ